MTIYRSYFSKNNTLISGNKTNNSKNPVCEISYGTPDKELSRFLFDVDLSLLNDKLSKGVINSKNIVSHTLNMTNTIRFAEEYVGKKSYATSINRASNFTLDLFKINQEWDEGTSYDFIYGVNYLNKYAEQESNWINRKFNTLWDSVGAYSAGTNTVIGSQYFRSGSENLRIDVSGFINSILSGDTSSNGLGIKFQDIYENTPTTLREAVGFHSKYTNTVYEPYVETVVDDIITDDRNFFFLDKENNLYLYSTDNVIVNNVTIYDYEDNIYSVISGVSVTNVSNGVYKISLTIDSDTYPDAVIFRDVWNITLNGKTKNISNMFYLISQDNYFNLNNQINFDNYFFSFQGIKEREKISSNHIRKIKVLVKEMYPNQNNFIPLDIEYRIFTTVAYKYEIDFVPFTKVNRTNYGYEFNLDTSWLIPQDYKIQIRLKNGYYYENKEILNFKIVSEGIDVIDYSLPTTTGYVPTTAYIPTTTEYIPTTTAYVPTTTEYIPTTTAYAPTTTVYVATTTDYVPTTTDYAITTTDYVPTTEYAITTTAYVATTTAYVATTTDYVPTTTVYVTTTSYVPTTTLFVPINNTYLVDFGVNNAGYTTDSPAIDGAYWNNFAYGDNNVDYNLVSGQTLSNLITNSGTTSNLSVEIASDNWVANSGGGGNSDLIGKSISGNIYPASAVRDSFNIANPFTGTMKINGCSDGRYYTIGILSSKYNEDINNFTVQGVEKAINPHGTFPGNNTLTIWNNVVSVGGVITITANQPTLGSFAWLELLEIIETSSPL